MTELTNIERLAEIQRLDREIAEAQRRRQALGGVGLSNGKTGADGFPATVTIVTGSEITPSAVQWVWPGWLARGKLEILAGAVATGKTTIAIDLAATITRGGKWPDGAQAEVGDVLVWSGEDDAEDTLLPRFLAAGGIRERIHFVKGVVVDGKKRSFDPSTDMAALLAAAQTISNLKMIIVDPVVLIVAGDSHKNTEVRRSLQPLAELAFEMSCAALGITHLNKGTAGRDPIERVTGSLAFTAGPRLALMAARPLDPDQKRRLVRIKSNIGPDGDGFEYSLAQEPLVGWDGLSGQRILWGAALFGSARELLNDIELPKDKPTATPKRDMATEFLREVLAKGPVPVKWIENAAKQAGLSLRTVKRAVADLGIIASRIGGFAGDGEWQWRFPDDVPPGAETDL
jgi:putative DNA primase/helicase